MSGPESQVEKHLCSLFRQAGWLVYKMDCGGGVADRLLVSPKAFHLYVEVKRPGKYTLDPQQVAWADDMRKRIVAGAVNNVVNIIGPISCRLGATQLFELYKDQ